MEKKCSKLTRFLPKNSSPNCVHTACLTQSSRWNSP